MIHTIHIKPRLPLTRSPSLSRLCSLVEPHFYTVGCSYSDCFRLAVLSPYEYISGYVFPGSIFSNATQAFRFFKANRDSL